MAVATALERQRIVTQGKMAEKTPLLSYAVVDQAIPCAVQVRVTSLKCDTTSLKPTTDSYMNKKTAQSATTDTSGNLQIKRIYNKREWALLSRKRTENYRSSHFQSSHSPSVCLNWNQNQYRSEDLRVIETHTRLIPYHETDSEKDKNHCKQIKVSSHKSSDLAKETSHMHAYLAEESFRRSQSDAFRGILSGPKVVKSHCNLKSSEKLGSFLCFIAVMMILLGSSFDQLARQFSTTKFDSTVDMLAATLKSPDWLEKLLASSNWLVGAEATINFQPYTMKHEGKSVIFLQSNKSTSISVKDEGDRGIRIFREPQNYGDFDIFYDNVNAAHIIVLNLVEGVAYDTFGDSFLKTAMVSQIMSRINITDQVVVHKSIRNIIEDFDFPDYNTFFIPEYGYYSPTEEVKQSIKNVINFLFENEQNNSLLYHDGNCTIQSYTHDNPLPFKDFGSIIAASSEYTLPVIELDMDYDKHSSWKGILTSEYSSYNVDIPQYILEKIPLNLKTLPLKVSHPHTHEFYDASSETWIPTDELNAFNSSQVSTSSHNHSIISLQLHSTLGVPITATITLDLKIAVPDEDEFGTLKGQSVPYMKVSINMSRLPDWLMEALHIFCAFRLFLVIFLLLATPVCLATGIVFLCKKESQIKKSQVEGDNNYSLLSKNPPGRNYGSISKTSLNC